MKNLTKRQIKILIHYKKYQTRLYEKYLRALTMKPQEIPSYYKKLDDGKIRLK